MKKTTKILCVVFTLILIFNNCETSNRNYIKYNKLDFIYWSGRSDELNSIDNNFYFYYRTEFLTFPVNIGTVDKIKLLDKLEEINFFEIADSIIFPDKTSGFGKGLYVKQYGYEKTIYWDFNNLRESKYSNVILELEKLLVDIKNDNIAQYEFPKRGSAL